MRPRASSPTPTYCSYDTGLDRGFTHYEDYVLEKVNLLQTAVIVDEILKTAMFLVYLGLRHDAALLQTVQEFLGPVGSTWSDEMRNRSIADFLHGSTTGVSRRVPSSCFSITLTPIAVQATRRGNSPLRSEASRPGDELRIVYDIWSVIDKTQLPKHYRTLARDCYDNCLAYLDERLGELFDDLQRRGVLDRTLVVITGDHGEGLGEHDLFEHGESLYSTEIRVPLLILPPAGDQPGRVVRDTVSLRDLPATVVDLIGLETGAPFPGRSLARLWENSSQRADQTISDEVLSELPSPSPRDSSHGRSPARRGSLVSLAEGDLVYIRNEGDGTEELFNERDDPRELTNRAASDTMRPVLERFRQQLARLKPRPERVAR